MFFDIILIFSSNEAIPTNLGGSSLGFALT